MKNTLFSVFAFLFCLLTTTQANESYMYRLILKDKGKPPFSLNNPQAYLSQKAIERRQKQGILVDSTDFPIDTTYFHAILQTGATIRSSSKWLNTIVVGISDLNILNPLKNLPFVDTLYQVWKGNMAALAPIDKEEIENVSQRSSYDNINVYGLGYQQINVNNGQRLHEAGFHGEGLSIAILDGGFGNVDKISFFNQDKIKEVKNFSHNQIDPFRTYVDHGTRVLSCMLPNAPGTMIGTAPEANYYLYVTEVSNEEYPVEEDYWVAALEYADSTGIDVINTSLGYSEFDDPVMNHTHSQLDGQTVPASRAAAMAVDKGMLLFIAAGNEGNKSWKKISIPSDAKEAITVGSVNGNKSLSSFSSIGLTADGRIKPDVMAMGESVCVINSNGELIFSNGTSYASPILAGLGACLWQALPNLTSQELVKLIQKNSSQYTHPDSLLGYGISDIYQAYAQSATGIDKIVKDPQFLYADMKENKLYINISTKEYGNCRLIVFSSLGNRVIERSSLTESIDISFLYKGIYIAYLQIGQNQYVRKFIKI